MRHLKIEFLENSKTSYHDRDWILFNSMFQILVDFVEKEFVCSWWIDWFHEENIKYTNELLDLYDWFIENYENDKLSDEYFYNIKFCKEQLKRIIDIMDYMWT
jgi:hypothetical protein